MLVYPVLLVLIRQEVESCGARETRSCSATTSYYASVHFPSVAHLLEDSHTELFRRLSVQLPEGKMQQQHDEAGKHDANTLLTTKGASLRLEDVISGPQGWRLFNVNFAPLFMPLERRLQTLAVSLQFGIFLFSGVISILTMVYLFFFTSSLKFIPLLYLAWMAYDWDTGEKGGRNNRCASLCCFSWKGENGGRNLLSRRFARGWWLWRYSARYFPVRVVKTTELDPNKSYLLGCHPHGILSFGIALAFSTDALKIEEIFPGLRFSLFTLPINFQMPGLREVALGLGMRSSSKASMEFALRYG